jgi:hypothetical protein
MEIEWLLLRYSHGTAIEPVAFLFLNHVYVFQPAVYFVGGGIEDRTIDAGFPDAFEDIEAAERVDLKILASIGDRAGHGYLTGQMQHQFGIGMMFKNSIHFFGVANIGFDEFQFSLGTKPT